VVFDLGGDTVWLLFVELGIGGSRQTLVLMVPGNDSDLIRRVAHALSLLAGRYQNGCGLPHARQLDAARLLAQDFDLKVAHITRSSPARRLVV
jgi:hypothetical protein